MTTPENERAKKELDDLGLRIKSQLKALQERGELAAAHVAYLKDAKDKHAEIEKKLEAAIRAGKPIAALKEEVQRDYNAIFEGLARFAQSLDADAMKAKRP